MPEFKDILCIVNPESGLRQGERMGRRLAARFEERGRRCVLRRTAGLGDAARWAAAAAAEGFDLILAVGGDGTVQEVVEGLMRTDTRVPVAHVPVGTANIIAIALSLPWSTRLAMDVIENGQVLPFDVGHVPLLERHFVLMAGIGYPARIIQGAPRRHKKLLGFLAYVASGLRNLFLPAHARITVDADGRILSAVGHTALVINIGEIHNIKLRLSRATSPHDGQLDVSVISSRTFWDVLKVLWRILTWRREETTVVRDLQARRVRIDADPPLPVQIDGEMLGTTPLVAEIVPQAIAIVVPRTYTPRSR